MTIFCCVFFLVFFFWILSDAVLLNAHMHTKTAYTFWMLLNLSFSSMLFSVRCSKGHHCSHSKQKQLKNLKSFSACLRINRLSFWRKENRASIPKIIQVVCIGTEQSSHKDIFLSLLTLFDLIFSIFDLLLFSFAR